MSAADPAPVQLPLQLSRGQCAGAILWPSFFAAGVATMVFFALFDPAVLSDIALPGHAISRELGYTAGFFLFWSATAAASLFTWILLAPAVRRVPRAARD